MLNLSVSTYTSNATQLLLSTHSTFALWHLYKLFLVVLVTWPAPCPEFLDVSLTAIITHPLNEDCVSLLIEHTVQSWLSLGKSVHGFWTDNNTNILLIMPIGLRSHGDLSDITMWAERELGLILYDILFCCVFSLVFLSVPQFSIPLTVKLRTARGWHQDVCLAANLQL